MSRAMKVATATPSLVDELDAILRSGRIRSLYQPIVDLDTGALVAYEALARGPAESPLELPAHLFEAARRAGRLADLDWTCRWAAVKGALEAGLRPPQTLFVNVEPGALHRPVPQDFKAPWRHATDRLRLVLDVTERSLTSSPTDLLWSVEWARELGWGLALDDVGADPRSLAMLPFLRPDVVKLDIAIIDNKPLHDVAAIAHAVGSEAERTGLTVLAEGIETREHLEAARAIGATLGQGWLIGRPRPLPDSRSHTEVAPRVRIGEAAWRVPVGFTPFDILREHRPVRRGPKPILFEISRNLENKALALEEPPVVIGAFQDDRFFTPATARLYARLARKSAFVAALGAGMSPAPAPGVRGARLFARDPLRGEWVVVVVGAHFSAAFAARDLRDEGEDSARRFDYVLTYERDLVTKVAVSLMAKVVAA